MKKLHIFIALFLMCFGLRSQSTLNSYTYTTRFFNNDFLQIYEGSRIAAPTMTLPNSISTYTSTTPFVNTDNLQVYNAIRGIGDAISTGTANSWNITGNSISTNTNFIGTTSNRSLLFYTNNTQRLKIDSIGLLTLPTNTITTTSVNGSFWYGGNTNTGFNFYSDDATFKGNVLTVGNATNSSVFYFNYNSASATETNVPGSQFGSFTNTDLGFFTNNGSPQFVLRKNNNDAQIKGRLRIGSVTTAPTATLDVTGTMSVSSTATLNAAEINNTLTVGNTSTLTGGNSGTLAVLSDAIFAVSFISNAGNPADLSTNYVGNTGYQMSPDQNGGRVYLPYNCTLDSWSFNSIVNGVIGSAENATVSVRANNSTNTQLSSSITYSNVSSINTFTGSGLSNNFNAGDMINIRIDAPTWVTNPTAIYTGVTLFFRRRL